MCVRVCVYSLPAIIISIGSFRLSKTIYYKQAAAVSSIYSYFTYAVYDYTVYCSLNFSPLYRRRFYCLAVCAAVFFSLPRAIAYKTSSLLSASHALRVSLSLPRITLSNSLLFPLIMFWRVVVLAALYIAAAAAALIVTRILIFIFYSLRLFPSTCRLTNVPPLFAPPRS